MSAPEPTTTTERLAIVFVASIEVAVWPLLVVGVPFVVVSDFRTAVVLSLVLLTIVVGFEKEWPFREP